MKIHKPLIIPPDSAWERKSWRRYTPIWFNTFIEGIKNIFVWMPVVYKDKNWDDFYIFEILKHKLLQQRKYLVEANRHMGVDDINRYITLCLNLIERIEKDYYDLEYMGYHESSYDWIDVKDNSQLKKLDVKLLSEKFDDYFKKYPNTYRKMMIKGKPKYWNNWDKDVQAMNLGKINQERCQALLFKILNEKINTFWD